MKHYAFAQEATEEAPALAAGDGDKKMAYAKDDFFDTMSCEALERLHLAESGRPCIHLCLWGVRSPHPGIPVCTSEVQEAHVTVAVTGLGLGMTN